ncbi:hypothetical protein [Stutzerimonas stutzeri]|uniref:hypothetical protein n=1 Tax=Stutzerimonas stutzeri TaxID=316 RepID=UPI0015E45D32|nr:hypothetical protein [Stutzerimonas stutzeri]MBA1280437.1 hypothetical protein [Stutzerimonas stutzeri]
MTHEIKDAFVTEQAVVWTSSDADTQGPIKGVVVQPLQEDTYDRVEVGPMYSVRLESGEVIKAFEDELKLMAATA